MIIFGTIFLVRAVMIAKLTLMKVGEKNQSIVSPFRTYSQRAIKRTYDEIEEYLQQDGYQPRFKDLMSRWEKEYRDIER